MCPYVEKADVRCATHLTLRNLADAFSHCVDGYATCPVYREMMRHADPNDTQNPAKRLAAVS